MPKQRRVFTDTIHPIRCHTEVKQKIAQNAAAAGMTLSEFLLRRGQYEECPPMAAAAPAVPPVQKAAPAPRKAAGGRRARRAA